MLKLRPLNDLELELRGHSLAALGVEGIVASLRARRFQKSSKAMDALKEARAKTQSEVSMHQAKVVHHTQELQRCEKMVLQYNTMVAKKSADHGHDRVTLSRVLSLAAKANSTPKP